ncbi:hypothetical protein DFP93_108132 [Aneurinibacillus soli]|nr:hypothetical protein DFP93_108132 [Aneurinibacillus soli]
MGESALSGFSYSVEEVKKDLKVQLSPSLN